MSKNYFVYILTNVNNTVLYTGITNNLERRTIEHALKINKNGFAEKYNCEKLVYYEQTTDVKIAIEREKKIKGLTRFKKFQLIKNFNPELKDLLKE